MAKEKILVTSALPYANGNIHLGHLSGAYLPADIYVRYKRLKGDDIIYVCGSDEHGVPITITADKEKVTPKIIIDRYHEANKAAFEKFGMSFDIYSRTSLPVHHETSQEFFKKYYDQGLLVEKKSLQFFAEAPVFGHGTGSIRGLFAQAAANQSGAAADIVGNHLEIKFASGAVNRRAVAGRRAADDDEIQHKGIKSKE